MGFFSYFGNKSVKKNIKKVTAEYKLFSPDARAGILYFIWFSRGISLQIYSGSDSKIVPIYHYHKNSEVAILDLIEECKRTNNHVMKTALYHHYYCAVASTYPDHEYGSLLLEMWDAIIEDHTDFSEVIVEMKSHFEDLNNKFIVDNNDVEISQIVSDPYVLLPHFLVDNHPLTNQVMLDETFGNLFSKK